MKSQRTTRKYPPIDLVKLYVNGGVDKWNAFRVKCYRNRDLNSIAAVLYGIQAGMDDLSKKNLNSAKMVRWFLLLQKSLETTARKIIKAKYPSPLDNPNKAKNFLELREIKRKRDIEFEKFLRDSSY